MTAQTFTAFVAGLGVKLTAAQHVLAAVAFDALDPVDLPEEQRALAAELFGAGVERIPAEARHVLALVKGARVGGSYVFVAMAALWRAVTADLRGLAPGERAVSALIAPDQRLSRQALRYARGAIQASPSLRRLLESETADVLVLRRPDRRLVSLEALPATRAGAAGRGRSLVFAGLDECSFFRSEQFVVNDREIYRALSPRVMPGGLIVLASTPWGEQGLLWDEFSANWGNPQTAIACRAPTLLVRPSLRMRAIVSLEERRDPENAAREFGAQFLATGAGLYFGRDEVAASVDPSAPPLPSTPFGDQAFAGCDLGLARDASALVIVHRDANERIRVAEVLELRPQRGHPLALGEVVARFVVVAARHGVQTIFADHFLLGEANRRAAEVVEGVSPELRERARCVRFAATGDKETSHARARDLFRAGRVRMPPEFGELREQLLRVTAQATSGGRLKISMPRRGGSHGDAAAAMIVALSAASAGQAPIPASVWEEFAQASRAASLAAAGSAGALIGLAGVAGESLAGLWSDAPAVPQMTTFPMRADQMSESDWAARRADSQVRW